MRPDFRYSDFHGALVRGGYRLHAPGQIIVDYLSDRFDLLDLFERVSQCSLGELASLCMRGDGRWRRVMGKTQRMRERGHLTFGTFARTVDEAMGVQ